MKFMSKKEFFNFSEEELKKKINQAKDLRELEKIYQEYLGKEGLLKQAFKAIKNLPQSKRTKEGKKLNEFKEKLLSLLKRKEEEIKKAFKLKEKEEFFDISLPPSKPLLGHLHPLTLVRRKTEKIFQSLGFDVVEGPEIEDEWHNFDALNIPPLHPARDILSLGKTFYLKEGGLLRTHTSSVQIRYMEKHHPPLRIVVPGKVFRLEATDASHEIEFWQLEGLMVDKDVKVSHFKFIMESFLSHFFEKEISIRLRPSYFPFTEPSFEVDLNCIFCSQKGCSFCKNSGWIEIAGAGMVHPKVFLNVGINPEEWRGFAFGLGLNRLAMLKYKIPDIRLFNSGDLRFLSQF